MTIKLTDNQVRDLIRRYHDGEATTRLAIAFNTNRGHVRRILVANNVTIRGKADAARLQATQRTLEQHRAWTRAANEARRKPIIDDCVRNETDRYVRTINGIAKSQTRKVGRGETELLRLLKARQFIFEPQRAVLSYNLDLSIAPLTVEVGWVAFPFRIPTHRRRIERLGREGWSSLYIVLTEMPTDVTADHVVAHYEQLRRNPTAESQYWVIRGDGECLACGSTKREDIATVPTPHRHRTDGSINQS